MPGQRRRVVLDHLHVHQRRAGAVGQGDAVAGADQGVGGGVEDLAVAAGGEDHGLGGEQLQRAVADVARHGAGDAAAVVLHERGGEPLLEALDLVVLHQLLVEHVQDRLAGDVGDVVGARRGCAAEGAGAELALLVAVEGDAEVLEVEDLVRRLAAHDLDRVLVAEVVRALDGVEGVRLPGVLGFSAALIPPWAALECERTGWTLEMIPTDAPASAAARAARWPARPAPMTRTSCEGKAGRSYSKSRVCGRPCAARLPS